MTTANDLMSEIARKRILLIGDTIVDVYVYGTAIGKSAETPTIVAREIETKVSLGGACLVARNIAELGAAVCFATLVGDDAEAAYVADHGLAGIEMLAFPDPERRTTVKKRFWVDGYKLLQFDQLDNRPIGAERVEAILAKLREQIALADAVVVADYRHGLMAHGLIQGILAETKRQSKTLYLDSQVSQATANHTDYFGAGIFTLNLKEARHIDPAFTPGADSSCFDGLKARLGTERIVVKLGEEGSLAIADGELYRCPALPVTPVDTCGAGDAFLGAFCLLGGTDFGLAGKIANAWAGLSTAVHGPSPASRADLVALLEKA